MIFIFPLCWLIFSPAFFHAIRIRNGKNSSAEQNEKCSHEAFSFYPFKFSIAFADEANPVVLFAVAARNRFFPRFCSPFSLPQNDGVF
jgi:hypothetical protein